MWGGEESLDVRQKVIMEWVKEGQRICAVACLKVLKLRVENFSIDDSALIFVVIFLHFR